MTNYKRIKKLGKGAYGDVWLVEDTKTKKRYAMKQFQMQVGAGVDGTIITELDILNRLNHPNVLYSIDTFEEKDCKDVATILPLADGDLSTIRPSEVNRKMLFQMLCGLFYLHTNFIAHNDIKQLNILRVGDTLKIADYGLSQINPSLTERQNVQTIFWRAPEIFPRVQNDAFGPFDPYKADVWALGVTFLGLLKGTNDPLGLTSVLNPVDIYHKTTKPEIIRQVRRFFDSDWEKDIPSDIAELIRAMLEIDPTRRVSAEEALKFKVFTKFKCPKKKLEYVRTDISKKVYESSANITMGLRKDMVKRMFKLVTRYELGYRVFFIAVDMLDRYIASCDQDVSLATFKITGLSCIFIADKLLNNPKAKLDINSVEKMLTINVFRGEAEMEMDDEFFTSEDILKSECAILKCLKWSPFRPTLDIMFPAANKKKLILCLTDNVSIDYIFLHHRSSCRPGYGF